MVNGQAGKGSKFRPIDMDQYRKNWALIFGEPNEQQSGSTDQDSLPESESPKNQTESEA